MWHFISEKLSETLQIEFICDDIRSIDRGDSHAAFKISDGSKRFFVKISDEQSLDIFQAEQIGLNELAQCKLFMTPSPICCGTVENKSYFAMEYISMQPGDKNSWLSMGQFLARMHQNWCKNQYGSHRDNYIGKTSQPNPNLKNWSSFFSEYRIGHLLRQLTNKGINLYSADKTIKLVANRLAEHHPKASLLHGDLWSGNVGFYRERPVIYDPAVYYGDRETDIAMSELFGGFPAAFYRGYNEVWPLDENYQERKSIYQLYHLLNHALLFGGHYIEASLSNIENL